jgi:hypothetical protein
MQIPDYSHDFFGFRDTYLNSLYTVIPISWIPQKLKLKAIEKEIKYVYYMAKLFNIYQANLTRVKILTRYISKLDIKKAVYMVKQAYYIRR